MIALLNQFDTMNRTNASSNDSFNDTNHRSSAMDVTTSLLVLSSSPRSSSKKDEEARKMKDSDGKENRTSPSKNAMATTEDDKETDHAPDHQHHHLAGDPLSLSSSSTSLFRSVSRRVTNESTNASDHSSHVLMMQQLQARQRRRQQQPMRNQRGFVLDPSYEPNVHDVIVNLRTSDRFNSSFDEKLSSMRPLFINMIRHERSDLQYTFLLDVMESIERDGGRFIRRDGASWIHVSDIVALMYAFHRLKQGMKQEQQVTAHEETEEKSGGENDDDFSDDLDDDEHFGNQLQGEEDFDEIDSDFMSQCSDDMLVPLSDDDDDDEDRRIDP